MSRTRSCAGKLGGGWERDEVQRTAKRYDNDVHGKDVGLRLLLLAAVIMATRALPPHTSRRRMTKKFGHRAKMLAALGRVRIRGSIVNFLPLTT